MATSKLICSVLGCASSKGMTAGLCGLHYGRKLRHGDPRVTLIKATPKGEVTRFIEKVVIPYRGGDCLLWPYATAQGRGFAKYKGKWGLASRAVCEAVHGAPPGSEYEAAHSCGRGHEGCVNPMHLRWATHRENEADKLRHGTSQHGVRNAQAKLSEDDVRAIRNLRGVLHQRAIGQRFGISQTAVSMIHLRKRWGWIAD